MLNLRFEGYCLSSPRAEIFGGWRLLRAGLIVVRPSTGGERIVIVDFVSGIVPKSPSCLDAKRVLYPVNDIKVLYEHIAKNVTNFWWYPQKAVPLHRKMWNQRNKMVRCVPHCCKTVDAIQQKCRRHNWECGSRPRFKLRFLPSCNDSGFIGA